MDARTFDLLTAEAARRPTRRAVLRLVAGGYSAGCCPGPGAVPCMPRRSTSPDHRPRA